MFMWKQTQQAKHQTHLTKETKRNETKEATTARESFDDPLAASRAVSLPNGATAP